MDPLCPHFGDCGGCHSQDVPYPDQVLAKQHALEALFAEFWAAPIPVTASPVQWHYRNKIDPAFSPMQYETPPPKGFPRETVLGYKRKGRWFWPLDVEDCLIAPDGMRDLFASVRQWYKERELRAFHSKSGEGQLRNLLVREGRHTGERMVVLITTTTGPGDPTEGFVDAVQRAWPAHSIQHGTSDSRADLALCDALHVLHGAPSIREELHIPGVPRPLSFQISPMSFFQTNTLATEGLYAAARLWVDDTRPALLYDLYGGMGTIAMACADLVPHVISVESVEAASIDGRANIAQNNLHNITFHTDKVENYLRLLRDATLNPKFHPGATESGVPDAVRVPSTAPTLPAPMPPNAAMILDPPRAGMNPKAIRRLLQLAPQDLLYISCNPKILAQELTAFTDRYTLTSLQGFDLFPHTPHVELMARLSLKPSPDD